MATLEFKCTMLKRDLKSKTEKLKYQKTIIERKKIKKLFYKDPNRVYRATKRSTITPKSILYIQNKMLRRSGKVYRIIIQSVMSKTWAG